VLIPNYFASALLLSIVLLGTGCSKKNTDVISEADFYGTWYYNYGTGWSRVILSANNLSYENINGNFTFENITWTQIANPSGDHVADYPTGYKIVGKMTTKTLTTPGAPRNASNTENSAAIGDFAVVCFYISKNRQSLCLGYWGSPHAGSWQPFIKQ